MALADLEEQTLWEGARAWSEYRSRWLGAMLSLVAAFACFSLVEDPRLRLIPSGALFLLSLIFPATIWMDRISHHCKVTSQRAITREGLISRKVLEIELTHIRDIRLTQTFLQRIFGNGSVELSSAGREGAEVVFRGIPKPEEVKELIRRQIRTISTHEHSGQ